MVGVIIFGFLKCRWTNRKRQKRQKRTAERPNNDDAPPAGLKCHYKYTAKLIPDFYGDRFGFSDFYRILLGSIGCRSPPFQLDSQKSTEMEELQLKNYKNSDYALNKFSEGIVYKFSDGIVEVTLADYLRDNPEKTEADFAKLKALSDAIYYKQDREDSAKTRRNISLYGIEETEQCSTLPLEDEWIETNDLRYAGQAVQGLLESGILTEVQQRRFVLHIFKGLSCRQIAQMEKVSHKNVAKSVNLAIQKLKKLFEELG